MPLEFKADKQGDPATVGRILADLMLLALTDSLDFTTRPNFVEFCKYYTRRHDRILSFVQILEYSEDIVAKDKHNGEVRSEERGGADECQAFPSH